MSIIDITTHFQLWMDPRAHNMADWFIFLNSQEHESSLYPFPPEEIESQQSWVTARHLKALRYYLTHGNKLVFLIRNEQADVEDETTFLFQAVSLADDESSSVDNEEDETYQLGHVDENNNFVEVCYILYLVVYFNFIII